MLKKIIKSILPKVLKEKIFNLKKNYFDSFYMKSYSQEGEDMILRRLFEKQKTGFYVDVGAHHPKRFSNTYFFYKQGWCGINIDAMPDSMKLFNKIRPRDINIEKPISNAKKLLTYYMFNEPALNGFSTELSVKRNGTGRYFIESQLNIETDTLGNILDSYLPEKQVIDFLSIDVEGLDFEVLQSNYFNKYQPKVILIEILNSKLEEIVTHEISVFMKENNYSIYAKAVNTVIYIDNEFLKNRLD